jgi:replicative DNA helicase
MLEHVTCRQNKSALIISLEMAKEELGERLIGSIGGINTRALKSGNLDTTGVLNDLDRIAEAQQQLTEATLYIEDDMSMTSTKIRAMARRIQASVGLDLVVVDYIQLMDGTGANGNERVGAISRGLKKLAKSLRVPVIVLSQMSRRVEIEGRDRPMLSDLRDSGNVEQDADKVFFLVRAENAPGRAILMLAKHRQGPEGDVPLRFNAEYTRFEPGEWIDFKEDDAYDE